MTPTTTTRNATSLPEKCALLADVLDLNVDHETDLTGLVDDLESVGYSLDDQIDDTCIDQIWLRAPIFTT